MAKTPPPTRERTTLSITKARHRKLRSGAFHSDQTIGDYVETVLDAGQKALAAAKKEGK